MRSAIVCFVTLLLLLQLPDTLQLDVKTCSNTYFITSRGKRLIGSAIDRKSASSLTDCLKQCRANSVCRGINYLLDNDSPTCSLVDTSSTSNGTLQYVEDSAIIYSAELACHSSDDIKCSRQWAYELTPSTDIKTQEMVISTLAGHDRGSCLD
uniref:Apple domain-containing protein n=1 Tax=Plectus sambesii TaxID=2011161 RepID=A0A914WY95_9BILA